MRRIAIALLSCTVLAGTAAAQTPPAGRPGGMQQPPAGSGEIRGSIIDAETNGPVASASVAVWSKEPAALVTGAITRPDGAFRIEGLRPGTYEIRITSLGYAAQTSELTIDAASPRATVGQVRLARSAVVLEGVEVTADRAAIAMAPDRNTYRVRDIAPAGGNAGDVLRATPAVEISTEGRVSLRGNENVAVQINGRPSPLRGAQLGAYLEQLPANMLERVEVIPNPSARYDPDGMAGIINIVMKENVDLGVSGGLTMSAANLDRYSTSGNLGYQRGELSLFGTYGYSTDQRSLTGINDRERYGAPGVPLSITRQEMAGETDFGGHNLNTTAEYKLNPRDLVFSGLSFNLRDNSEATLSATTELNGSNTTIARYDRLRNQAGEGMMLDAHIGFKRTLEPQKHEINTELRFNRSDDRDNIDLWRQPMDAAAGATRVEQELNEVDALSYRATAQVDYTRTLAARTKLETGYKGEGRWLDREYLAIRDPFGTGQFIDRNLSNDFEFDEQVHAVYGVLSHGIGKVDLQAGLRAEHASRDFALGAADRYPYDYNSLFPSALANYKLSDATSLRASYSRRIRRPGTQELNPFAHSMDVHNVFFGNPNLNPEYTDAVELSLQRNGRMTSFQLSPFFRRTTDVIRFVIDTDAEYEGREITSISFKNLDHSTSWGTDVNGSLRMGKRFNGFASFNLFKMVTEGGSEASTISTDAVTWSARLNGTSEITPSLTAQAMYFYRAPMEVQGGRFSQMQMLNLSLRQKINEQSSVTLRFIDPLNAMRFRVEAGDDNIFQITERRMGVRAVQLTYQYTFGQRPRMRQPRQQEQPQEPQVGFP